MALNKYTINMLFRRSTVHMLLSNDQFGLLIGAVEPRWVEGSDSMTGLYEALMAQCTPVERQCVLVPQPIFLRFKALVRQLKRTEELPSVMEDAFNIEPVAYRTGEDALEARQRLLLKNVNVPLSALREEEPV